MDPVNVPAKFEDRRSRTVCGPTVQLTPRLSLKRLYEKAAKFVDFSNRTQVWRRPSKKRLRISTKNLYCQKLEALTYSFATENIGL